MKTITLLTDFGLSDNYVGVMKGVILSINPSVTIVDITHHIERQDIYHAAFLLESSWKYFPEDTIHTIVVDPGVGSDRKIIVLKKGKTLFVAPDNGVLSTIYTPKKDHVFHCDNPQFWLKEVSQTFHGRDIFAPIAARLSAGVPIEELGTPIYKIKTSNVNPPKIFENKIVGKIVYIDHFGNCITNITADMLPEQFEIEISERRLISDKNRTYSDVKMGEALILIDSFRRLEIAIRNGNAAENLGLSVGKTVEVKPVF
jgi:hypothetical protein